jgi:hypothetical protein
MTLHRAKVAIGIATAGMAMTLVAAAPSSASQFKSSAGSNPHGAFCKLYKSETSDSSKSTVALEKAVEANNWPAAKKDITAEFKSEGKLVKELTAALSSAPSKVRTAAASSLKAVPAEEKAVGTSNSVAQYEAAVEKIFDTPKLEADGKVFEQYETATCGTTTVPT